MIDLIVQHVLPSAGAILPAPMTSPAASAMLVAIGLQESGFAARGQDSLRPGIDQDGPAHGFWMFEVNGIRALLANKHLVGPIYDALHALCYPPARTLTVNDLHQAIRYDDVLAAVFARCLLWTHDDPLPRLTEPDAGWKQYVSLWRPGKPRPETWAAHYADAWTRIGLEAQTALNV